MKFHRWVLLAGLAAVVVPFASACSKQGEARTAQTPGARDGTGGDGNEAHADSITFTKVTPAIGQKRRSTDKLAMTMAFDITMNGTKVPLHQSMIDTKVVDEEVLATTDKVITKEKFTYVDKTKTKILAGKEEAQKSSRVGKSFILELKDGKVVVTDEAGAPASEHDTKALLKDHRSFGKPDPIEAALPEGPVRVGDKLDGLAKALLDHMNKGDDGDAHGDDHEMPSVQDVEIRLVEIHKGDRGLEGVFAIKMTMAMTPKDSPMAFAMPLSGTMTVRANDGWPTAMVLKGPIQLSPLNNTMQIAGTGSMTIEGGMTYP